MVHGTLENIVYQIVNGKGYRILCESDVRIVLWQIHLLWEETCLIYMKDQAGFTACLAIFTS